MLSLSYSRLLGTRSIIVGLVTLAILLAFDAVPVSGATVTALKHHRFRPGSASVTTSVTTYSSNKLHSPADTVPDSAIVARPARPRGGYIITEDQLADEQDYSLGSVLVAHFPGIRVIHGSDADRIANRLNLNMTGTPCFIQVFMNGVLVQNGAVDWVNVRDLAAIEYRTPGNIPVQYQNRLPGAMCGALLLWSKYM